MVNEVASLEDVPCNHASQGCNGHFDVAYAGPKAFMSAELHHAHTECTCSQLGQVNQVIASCGAGAPNDDVLRLCEMGFAEDAVRHALAEADAQGDCSGHRVELALDHLMAVPSQTAAQQLPPTTSTTSFQSCTSGPRGAFCYPASAPVDTCICSICTEDLEPANAAMRCSGQHGKRHYYHAHCLSQWIQQCRRDNQAPTCPECRGELQVRARRLQEFLAENGSKLDREEVEALRAVHDAAMSESDSDGWSGIKKETLIQGLAIGAGMAVAGLALAAAMGAFSGKRDEDKRQ